MAIFRSDIFSSLLTEDALAAWAELVRSNHASNVAAFCIVLTHFETPQSLYFAGCYKSTFRRLVTNAEAARPERGMAWAALDVLHNPADWPESPANECKASRYFCECEYGADQHEPLSTLCERVSSTLDARGIFGPSETRTVLLAVVAPND